MRLLIIRPGALGDTLVCLPVLHALRTMYQPVHITLVGNAAVLPLARAWGIADAVYDYEDPLWSDLFSVQGIRAPFLLACLPATDLIVCWLRDVDGLVERNLRALSRGRVVVTPGRPLAGTGIHITAYLAQTLHLPQPLEVTRSPIVPEVQRTDHNAPLALHPGSGGAAKCWPVASFAELIVHLWQRERAILLLAGPAERDRLTHLLRLLPEPPRPDLLTIVQNIPLLELATRLYACRGYLGNDAGVTHLAALLALPTLALFGPSDPMLWRPVGPAVRVLHAPDLSALRVEQVLQSLDELLGP